MAVAPAGNAGRGVDSRSAQNEDHEMPEENPAATHLGTVSNSKSARRALPVLVCLVDSESLTMSRQGFEDSDPPGARSCALCRRRPTATCRSGAGSGPTRLAWPTWEAQGRAAPMLMILARTQKQQQAVHRPPPASPQRRRRCDPPVLLRWSMPAMAPGMKHWARRRHALVWPMARSWMPYCHFSHFI